jgi:hypothetical protein
LVNNKTKAQKIIADFRAAKVRQGGKGKKRERLTKLENTQLSRPCFQQSHCGIALNNTVVGRFFGVEADMILL